MVRGRKAKSSQKSSKNDATETIAMVHRSDSPDSDNQTRQSPSRKRQRTEVNTEIQRTEPDTDIQLTENDTEIRTSDCENLDTEVGVTLEKDKPKDNKKGTMSRTYHVNIDPEKEEKLVDCIQGNPLFYDKTHKDFKDTSKKNCLWENKGQEFGLSGKYNCVVACTFIWGN